MIRRLPTLLGELHARVEGKGEAIVMWPSLLMDHTLYADQIEHFSRRYRVIALDPPGHGKSEPLTRHFTIHESATCLVDVLDALELERAHVFGNSWGGMMGAVFAAKYPERAGSCVLANGTASRAQVAKRLANESYGFVNRSRLLRPFVDRAVVRSYLGPTARCQPELEDRVAQAARTHEPRSAAFAVRSVAGRRDDLHPDLGSIRTPVLIVAGNEDPSFPVPELKSMAAAIPNSELAVLEGVGHLAFLEAPERLNALAEDFLSRQT